MTDKKLKILFAAYRDWAKNAYFDAYYHLKPHCCEYVETPEDLERRVLSEKGWDVVVLVGWSWKVPKTVLDSCLVIGMHPSDLPNYSGGSPIQNQILDGLEFSQATLFKLNEKFDAGEIIDKEPIDLRGHLSDVLTSISNATVRLVVRFVEKYPNNVYLPQTGERHVVKRLKPEASRLPMPDDGSSKMTCEEMWDHIRCREDPYPNAYFEDHTGRLIIKQVEFEPKR